MAKDLTSYARDTETDFCGLGHCCSWLLFSNPNHKTRVVSVYNLGKRKSNHLRTIYQRHLSYIQLNNLDTTPYGLFCTDFTNSIREWLAAGERVLIFTNMNERILTGKLATHLLDLGLLEATHLSWGDKEPNTHINGSKPIDGVYHTSNLEVTSTLMLSFHEGVGNHRTVLVDITARSLLGTEGLRIVRPPARRLAITNRKAVARFNKYVESKMQEHRLHNRLVVASKILQKNPQNKRGRQMLEVLDTQTTEILIAGEKQCRKITNNPLPFCAQVAYWTHRKWAYQGLLKITNGACKNVGNARRRAKKEGLGTYNLSEKQCSDGIKLCNDCLIKLRGQANGLRKVHLCNCLISAKDTKDKEWYRGILRVIEREEQKNVWRSICRVTDDPRLGAITFVQWETDDGIMDITDKDEMCDEIQSVTERQFALAESAPTSWSSLANKIGFLSNTKFALNLLMGLEAIPDDVDPATMLIIEEMQRLWNLQGNERFSTFELSPSKY